MSSAFTAALAVPVVRAVQCLGLRSGSPTVSEREIRNAAGRRLSDDVHEEVRRVSAWTGEDRAACLP